jgi:hypothetical protein
LVRALAERGDNVARVAYRRTAAYELDPSDADYIERFANDAGDSLRYLQEAATEGDIDALWALADAYSEGRIVSADPTYAGAYLLAWSYAMATSGPVDTDGLLRLADSQLGADVDPAKEAQVAHLALGIISKFRGTQ